MSNWAQKEQASKPTKLRNKTYINTNKGNIDMNSLFAYSMQLVVA
jgi:hypothetical protein